MRVFLAVVQQALALLKHTDGEGVRTEVYGLRHSEREEGLGQLAGIGGSETVVELRVRVLRSVVLQTDRSP